MSKMLTFATPPPFDLQILENFFNFKVTHLSAKLHI